VRSIRPYLPLLLALLVCLPFAQAQSQVDFNIGFGGAHASSLGLVDINTLNPCSNLAGETCANTPALSGFFLGFGGNLMLWKHLGIGVDVALQPAKQNYLTFQTASAGVIGDVLQTRVTFYDFDAIYAPYSTKRVQIQLKGGIGGANVKFYENFSQSSTVLGNTNSSQFAGSANHFQVNAAGGVQLYLTDHFFIRPEGGLHWVNNFAQFGSNVVPYGMVWVGYSIGDR
jgi:Outer membrane protein beta-barrel domain